MYLYLWGYSWERKETISHSFSFSKRVELWAESDWPDLSWIFSNQHVRLTAGDGVDGQLHRWHNKALADWQPQPLAQTVEWSVLAQTQDRNVNQT